jgi:hypothetical protein
MAGRIAVLRAQRLVRSCIRALRLLPDQVSRRGAPSARVRFCLRTRKRNPIEPDANSQAKSAYGGSVKNRPKFAKLLFAQ